MQTAEGAWPLNGAREPGPSAIAPGRARRPAVVLCVFRLLRVVALCYCLLCGRLRGVRCCGCIVFSIVRMVFDMCNMALKCFMRFCNLLNGVFLHLFYGLKCLYMVFALFVYGCCYVLYNCLHVLLVF